jgi:hypothetical protein
MGFDSAYTETNHINVLADAGTPASTPEQLVGSYAGWIILTGFLARRNH